MNRPIANFIGAAMLATIPLAIAMGEAPVDVAWWPQFLGPDGRAMATNQSIPLDFGPGENRIWGISTPEGNSSPVVWDEKIFITGYEGGDLMVLCYDRGDGHELWRQSYPSSFEEDYFHVDCTPAASTSCTDGTRLVSCLGTYGLVVHTLDGEELWQREFQDRSMAFGTCSSPVIWDDRVYLLRDTPKGSSLLCLDADSGKELWVASREAKNPSFSTPCLWHHEDSTEVVVAGSGALDAYNAITGEQVWTVTGMPVFVCPTPVVQDDVLVFGAWATAHVGGTERTKSAFADGELTEAEQTDANALIKRFDQDQDGAISRDELPESRLRDAFRFYDSDRSGSWESKEIQRFLNGRAAPGKNVMVAVRAGGKGDITETHVLWESTKNLPYVASPSIVGNRVYCLKKGGLLTAWDLKSGEMIRPMRLGVSGEYYATPVVVGDKLIVAAERGKVLVLSTDEKPRVLSTNDFGESIYATPAVVENHLYVRTKTHLHAIAGSN